MVMIIMIISNDDDDDDHQGELHLTESVCPRDFLGELEYWGLSALHLGEASAECDIMISCCHYHVMLNMIMFARLEPHQLP